MSEPVTIIRKPIHLEAVRWFRNGDHPQDKVGEMLVDPLTDTMYPREEGAVVRYYRHPHLRGDHMHHCGHLYHDHGFIDNFNGGHRICPGDWIITDENGGHFPVTDEHFRHLYEIIDLSVPR